MATKPMQAFDRLKAAHLDALRAHRALRSLLKATRLSEAEKQRAELEALDDHMAEMREEFRRGTT